MEIQRHGEGVFPSAPRPFQIRSTFMLSYFSFNILHVFSLSVNLFLKKSSAPRRARPAPGSLRSPRPEPRKLPRTRGAAGCIGRLRTCRTALCKMTGVSRPDFFQDSAGKGAVLLSDSGNHELCPRGGPRADRPTWAVRRISLFSLQLLYKSSVYRLIFKIIQTLS